MRPTDVSYPSRYPFKVNSINVVKERIRESIPCFGGGGCVVVGGSVVGGSVTVTNNRIKTLVIGDVRKETIE